MTKLTIKEVAKEAGVSTATVSRVLNDSGYVSEDARRQVVAAIERLHYKPNTIARSLKQERTGGIGFILPDLTNPYFMAISRRLQQKLAAEGYYVFFMDSGENPEKERQALDFLLEKRVEAILLAGTGGNVDLLQRVQNSPTPLVLLDRQIPGVGADIVMEDNEGAASEAVRYLVKQGHRSIGLLHGPHHTATAVGRREGALAGLREAGLPIKDEYAYTGDYTRASGIEAIHRFMRLSEPPTAIFSANNEMTFGLYLGLKQLELPLDLLEVVSFGELDFASLFPNRLTAIVQDPEAIADAAASLLLKRTGAAGGGSFEKRVLIPRLARQ